MKRSQINLAIRHSMELLEQNGLRLPPFAYWSPDEWRQKKPQLDNIFEIMLGWDVTDYGKNDFLKVGAVLFTIRNGSLYNKAAGTPYAEKLILLRHEQQQEIPFHFHTHKTEDIINRGGGVLMLELYNSTPDGGLDQDSDVVVRMDGITHTLKPGSIVTCQKGESITLTPLMHHRFWAQQGAGDLIVGEVSSINDDNTDNTFLVPLDRFTAIDEDEPALWPLCNEYDRL